MNKSDLIKAVETREQVPFRDAERIINAFLDVISLSLAYGEDCSIRNFGKFEVRNRQETTRLNPKTGDPIHVSARRAVGFRPAPHFKDRVNGKRY